MKARLTDSAGVGRLLDAMRAEGHEVVAPVRGKGKDTFFEVITDANRSEVTWHLANPGSPPKRYLLPPMESLLRITREGGEYRVVPLAKTLPRVLFGIRSCDLAGIGHLDRFFLGGKHRDDPYGAHRAGLFLVNIVCTDVERDIGDDCFCVCTDTGPAAREGFDLQLMDLGGDEWMMVAGTAAGEARLAGSDLRPCTAGAVARRREILEEVRKRFRVTTSWFPATVRYVSRGEVLESTWEEVGRRCVECGGCTYVCPACTCFTMTDRQTGPDTWERVRLWDSCALGGFTRMAGGHNPRRAVHDRRNRRFFRKLAQYFIQRELSMACVGCGRCVSVCHGDVGMPSVVEMIRRATVGLAGDRKTAAGVGGGGGVCGKEGA